MSKSVLYLLVAVILYSCKPENKELFKETDSFVESLNTDIESYGLLGGEKYRKTTTDGLYAITPIGRLINVKILKEVTSEEYENLESRLKEHYKTDNRVKDVYISQAGTVMIDCRK